MSKIKPIPVAPTEKVPYLPAYDKIVVKPVQAKTKTEGGLIIPDIAQEQYPQGTIIAAGPDALDLMHYQGHRLGDTVIYGRFAGVWGELHKDDTESSKKPDLLIMNVRDILANATLAERFSAGKVKYIPRENNQGKIQYYVEEK